MQAAVHCMVVQVVPPGQARGCLFKFDGFRAPRNSGVVFPVASFRPPLPIPPVRGPAGVSHHFLMDGSMFKTASARPALPAWQWNALPLCCSILLSYYRGLVEHERPKPSVFDAPGASSFLAAIAVALIERDFRSVARSTNAACTQLLLPGVVIARRSSGYGFMIFIGSMKLIPYFENDTYGMALFFSQLLKRLRYSGSAQGPFQETLRRFGILWHPTGDLK